MIYTNLFKPNKPEKTKTIIYYMVESRRYKFNLIFDKKFTSMLSALALGSFMIASINVGIYAITTSTNASKLAALEDENNNYLASLTQLESQQAAYLKQKVDVDNIYNISDKPTKWSSIIDSIAEQLPYDTVLTSVTTITQEDAETAQGNSDTNNSADNTSNNNNTSNTVDSTVDESTNDGTDETVSGDDTYANASGDSNAVVNNNQNSESTLDEQISSNESIIENDVIEITGKSLSMVNLSLFLDKLDKLDIFSKVECLKAERDSDSSYYSFLIHAYLN